MFAVLIIPSFSQAATLDCPVGQYEKNGECVPIEGGAQPWCSSPTAPGWRVDLPGGGCGTTTTTASGTTISFPIFFQAGTSVVKNGVSYDCPFWFFSGCVLK